MVRLRVFVIDPVESTRESLAMLLHTLGHEVIPCATPDFCPGYRSKVCACPRAHACADVLFIGQHLSGARGIDFIRQRRHGNCHGLVRNMFLVCQPWSAHEEEMARELGCRFLQTPIDQQHLDDILQQVARQTDPNRQLTPLDQLELELAPLC